MGELETTKEKENENQLLFECFASCHGIVKLENEELLGDFLDLEMLKFSGWEVDNQLNSHLDVVFAGKGPKDQSVIVQKMFEFESKL